MLRVSEVILLTSARKGMQRMVRTALAFCSVVDSRPETIYQLHSPGSIESKNEGALGCPTAIIKRCRLKSFGYQTRSSGSSQAAQQRMLHGMYVFIIYNYIWIFSSKSAIILYDFTIFYHILPNLTMFYHIPKLFPVRNSTLSPPLCRFTVRFRVSRHGVLGLCHCPGRGEVHLSHFLQVTRNLNQHQGWYNDGIIINS